MTTWNKLNWIRLNYYWTWICHKPQIYFNLYPFFYSFTHFFRWKWCKNLPKEIKRWQKRIQKRRGCTAPIAGQNIQQLVCGIVVVIINYEEVLTSSRLCRKKNSWRHAFIYDLTYVLSQSLKLDFLNIIKFFKPTICFSINCTYIIWYLTIYRSKIN